MDNLKYIIHPIIRILFLALFITGIILTNKPLFLLTYYLLFTLPLILVIRLISVHYRLLLFGIVPIFLTFIILYIIVLKGSNGSWEFVIIKCLKILLITSGFQISLSIPPIILLSTFKSWGIKGETLLTLLGAFTVWADIKTRTNQIITARFARGFIQKRNFINTARQFPYLIIPLIIGVIRTSSVRADIWSIRNMPAIVGNTPTQKINYPSFFNILLIIIPTIIILIGIFIH